MAQAHTQSDPLNSRSFPAGASPEHLLTLRLKRLLDADINRVLAQHSELSLAQWRILSVLSRASDEISQKELVRRPYITQGQASRALTALQKDGLVEARQSQLDRRSWDYAISDTGRDRFTALLPHMEQRREALDAALNADEKAEFTRLMVKIARVAQARLEESDPDARPDTN